ncbi:CAP-associated domain-containing protein [Latilactobacillus fragifolii]|uniref:CAP-associated domain-containing protein n=1 Tax=Latilactobacillus fragifolii TaxID=2814244 RepID=UPI001ABBB790|nr:CAP-associated domain-containing protein [Latilactobacillus fragifolii]
MIKGTRRLIVALLIWLIILYGWPIIQPPVFNPPKDAQGPLTQRSIKQIPHTKTQGPAKLINQPAEQLIATYGQPVEQQLTDENQRRWLFHLDSRQYVEALIDNQSNQTQQIMVVGANNDVAPFHFFQKRAELTKNAVLPTSLSVTLHEQQFKLRLTPEQHQQTPLVAFKNQTFAILVMQQERLTAILYLNANRLLQTGLYQVVSKTPVPVDELAKTQQSPTADQRQLTLEQTVQTLRQNNDQSGLAINQLPLQNAQHLMSELTRTPTQWLTKKGLRNLRQVRKQAVHEPDAFLTATDFKQAPLKAAGFPRREQFFYWPQGLSSQELLLAQQQNLALQLAINNPNYQHLTLLCTDEQAMMIFD